MKKMLILTSALWWTGLCGSGPEQRGQRVVSSAPTRNRRSRPITFPSKETRIKVNMLAADNPATPLKAQVEAKNITGDVFDIEVSDAIRLCDEGALVEINPDDLRLAAPDGTPAKDDFIPGALRECAVANIFWGTVIASTRPSRRQPAQDRGRFLRHRQVPRQARPAEEPRYCRIWR